MTPRDDFGIITRNRELRAQYGNRRAHGISRGIARLPDGPKTTADVMATNKPPSKDPSVQKTNPFLVRASGLYLRGYMEGTKTKRRVFLSVAPVETIIEALMTYLGEPRAIALGARRSRSISWPRQAAMLLARIYCGASLPEIGRTFGNKDHTTVMYSVEKVAERLDADCEATRHMVDTMLWVASLDPSRLDAFMIRWKQDRAQATP